MHKLVILIEASEQWQDGEKKWPEFLHQAEEMPGLLREATSQVETFLFGTTTYLKMHELFFQDQTAVEHAMASDRGRAAGKLLQQMTGGHMTLYIAEHREDDIANIRQYRSTEA